MPRGFLARGTPGHLEFDGHHLRMWGLGIEATAERGSTKAIRFHPNLFRQTLISILFSKISESEASSLPGRNRELVRASLTAAGWHVVENRDRSPRVGGRKCEW